MKKFWISLLVSLALTFIISTAALAENTQFYMDYAFGNIDKIDIDIDTLTVGFDYSDQAMFGASYAFGVKFDPDNDSSGSIWDIYGGYNFINNDQGSLGLLLAYNAFNYEGNGSNDRDATSLGIGFKGVVKLEAFNLSLLYVYGFDNEINNVDNDADYSEWELKAGFMFNDATGMYIAYRSYSCSSVNVDNTYSQFGIGFQYNF